MARSLLFPFQVDPRGGIAYTEDLGRIIQQNIISAVGTQIGERVRNYRFGTRALDHVFDPNDDGLGDDLEETVRVALQTWVPEIRVLEIQVSQDLQDSNVGLLIRYSLNNQPEASVTVPLPLREDFA